jgi:pimeloyl-ACP methyl ester carboxylesterase
VTTDEMRAAGRLATRTLADTITQVEQVHRAVAARAFAVTVPMSLPARLLHDGIATCVYAAVRGGALACGVTASEIVALALPSARPAGSTRSSNLALAVLNATLGDELAAQKSPLAIRMALRHVRTDIAPRRDAVEAAFPEAASKVAVFLHGLGETEESWRFHADNQGSGTEYTYGSRLAQDLGYTPVYLRYNSGLHISENGQLLTTLLEDLARAWPVPVAEVILVGHSMGGLVARSACHYAQENAHSWVSILRHVFYLGTPHLGAGLEQSVNRLSTLLGRLHESQPLASILNRRSAGIKDLYAGYLVDDDWRNGETGSAQRNDVPLVPWANHYTLSATVTTSEDDPLGRFLGDLLVQPASAHGRSNSGQQIPFRTEHSNNFPGLHHFHLLNHPSIYNAMRDWLDPTSKCE